MERDEFYNALYLAHHGIKGQRWGIRRFQNEDGSLTAKGKKREQKQSSKEKSRKALKVALGTTLAVAATAGAIYAGKKIYDRYANGQAGARSFMFNPKSFRKHEEKQSLKYWKNAAKEGGVKFHKEAFVSPKPQSKSSADYNVSLMETLNKMRQMERNQNRR